MNTITILPLPTASERESTLTMSTPPESIQPCQTCQYWDNRQVEEWGNCLAIVLDDFPAYCQESYLRTHGTRFGCNQGRARNLPDEAE